MPLRQFLAFPVVMAAVYVLAWVVGLALHPDAPALDAADAEVAAHFESERARAFLSSLLVHGVTAAALVLVMAELARSAARRGQRNPGLVVLLAAAVGAGLSLVQMALGVALATTAAADDPGRASTLFDAINRLDGVKMLAFAAMALGGVVLTRRRILPRRAGVIALMLAGTLVLSATGYLLLDPGMATAAFVSLPLLLIWVGSIGVVVGRR